MTLASPLAMRKSGYLASLDGWRAIAIIGVLIQHDTVWVIGGVSFAYLKDKLGFAVPLFFAISGLLITTRILEEESLLGYFDIKRFYIRRIFRIQPAALGYLATTGLLTALGAIHEHWFYWLAALLLFENFTYRGSVPNPGAFFSGHFWTLAVEEHFYILLSVFLLFVKRYRLALLAALYFSLLIARRFADARGLMMANEAGVRRTYWQLYLLIAPAAAAVALRRPVVRAWVERYLHPWAVFSATLLLEIAHTISLNHRLHLEFSVAESFKQAAVHIMRYCEIYFTVWIVATMLHVRSFTTRVLESPPFIFIGRLSYSLYLWHVLFFFRSDAELDIGNPVLLAISDKPARYLATLAAAMLSYYLLEKPMMRLGHRLAPPVTPGRNDLDQRAVSR